MKKKLLAMIMTMAAFLALMCAPAFAAEQRDSISVTGRAEEEVAPDMATLYGTLEQKAPTAAEAREGLAKKIQALVREMHLQMIPNEDVQTIRYSLEPQYIYERNSNRQKADGYLASTEYKIKVKNLDKLSAVLDKSIGAGMNVDRVEFGLNNRALYENKLLDEAVSNARARASVVARAGGRTLGTLMNATMDTTAVPVRMERSMLMAAKVQNDAAAETPTQLNAGVMTVSARVSLVFALQ
ncbi:MAG: SIMPL domain-containing protein [Succiniclasticum sp.]|jgi:uncharacterized protein YggE|nr:SIMPL domain-containing protein [Succiniclasticum sp.]MEE3479092.1 SIMPL domain-containing protein [Succiniclasticum sp.]